MHSLNSSGRPLATAGGAEPFTARGRVRTSPRPTVHYHPSKSLTTAPRAIVAHVDARAQRSGITI